MAIVLHTIIDGMTDPDRPVLSAYSGELTRALIATAPTGVAGIFTSALARPELIRDASRQAAMIKRATKR